MGNVNHVFQGVSNFEISKIGEKQLEYLKKRFENIHLDKVYSSPLLRTQRTAQAIIGDKDIPLELLDGLIELSFGVFEGKNVIEAFDSVEGIADIWNNRPQDFVAPKGDSMRDAYQRIWEALKYIIEENRGKTVACATHGGILRCLLCRLLTNDINNLKDIPYSENTAVTLLEVSDDDKISVVFNNDFSHLPNQLKEKLSTVSSFFKEESK